MVDVLAALENRGYKGTVVSVRRIEELRQELEVLLRKGSLKVALFRERLTGFNFTPPKKLPEAESLIVVAVPQPEVSVNFQWKGKHHSIILPPTYLLYPDRDIETLLKPHLAEGGYWLEKASLPLKSLAVHSGLGEYGRNNICYVPEMGSYHRLMAYYTNLQCREESWHEHQIRNSCLNCLACISACPAGAILKDRYLIRAERCLTYLNERRGKFPSWLDPSAHHCLMGCMRCQRCCPSNHAHIDWVEDRGLFEEEETELILKGVAATTIPSLLKKKLEELDLMNDYPLLSRNLRALLRDK